MIEYSLKERILKDIEKSYVDMENPQFHFKKHNYSPYQYSLLITNLKEHFFVEETSDLNYDQARTFVVKMENTKKFYLYLSLVGLYSFVITPGGKILCGKNIEDDTEKSIFTTTNSFGIEMLDKECLSDTLPISINFDHESKRVNSVTGILFSTGLVLP
jgi:hypothetical protein